MVDSALPTQGKGMGSIPRCYGNALVVGGENRKGKEGLPDGGVPHLLPTEAAW